MSQHADLETDDESASSSSSDEDVQVPPQAHPILAALLVQPVPVPEHVSILVEGIDEMSYMIWNVLATVLGAIAVFTCDHTSACHFPDAETASRFILTISSFPRTPIVVRMFPHTRQNFDNFTEAMRQSIMANPRLFEEIY